MIDQHQQHQALRILKKTKRGWCAECLVEPLEFGLSFLNCSYVFIISKLTYI